MRSDEFKVFITEISKLLSELNKHASGDSIDQLAYFEDVLGGIEREGGKIYHARGAFTSFV